MSARGITYKLVYGASEPFDVQLKNNGAALDGTGYTVGLALYQASEAVSGVSVAWLTQASGTVRVTGHESLAIGEYQARFTLTDTSSKVGHVPNGGEADRWIVVAVQA